MAKVYKVTMYLTDANEYYDFDKDTQYLHSDLEVALDRILDMPPTITDIKESDKFEWDDDLQINKTDSTLEDYEKYFTKENPNG